MVLFYFADIVVFLFCNDNVDCGYLVLFRLIERKQNSYGGLLILLCF